MKHLSIIFLLLMTLNNISFSIEPPYLKNKNKYSFLCLGHAYGNHFNSNVGLHPPLVNKLKSFSNDKFDFIIFTGDFTRNGTNENWNQMLSEIDELKKPLYFTLGNNDNTPSIINQVQSIYGNSYYSFKLNSSVFIFLDTQKSERSISLDQIEFLNSVLDTSNEITNYFIFFHDVLWNNNPIYSKIKSNNRSRYDKLPCSNNFWSELIPLISKNKKSNYYIITGDVAGNKDAIPAFYDKIDNIHLISSGMGEVMDENLLKINLVNDSAFFEFHMINSEEIKYLDDFTVDKIENYYNPKINKISAQEKILLNLKNKYFQRGLIFAFILMIPIIGFIIYRKRIA